MDLTASVPKNDPRDTCIEATWPGYGRAKFLDLQKVQKGVGVEVGRVSTRRVQWQCRHRRIGYTPLLLMLDVGLFPLVAQVDIIDVGDI